MVEDTKKFSKQARVRARRTAVQALYQWLMAGTDMSDVIREFENDRTELKKADKEYFIDLVRGTVKNNEQIQEVLTPILDRPFNEIDPVEMAVLELSTYELMYHSELPWRVVINEAVELAKFFGAEESHKYINSILDKAAQRIRPQELTQSAHS